jgi:hypothetical protein
MWLYPYYIILLVAFSLWPSLAGTRAQSGDRYGSGMVHSGQVLRGSLPMLSPPHYIRSCILTNGLSGVIVVCLNVSDFMQQKQSFPTVLCCCITAMYSFNILIYFNISRDTYGTELNLCVFYESKSGKYLGYKTSQGNITYIQQ